MYQVVESQWYILLPYKHSPRTASALRDGISHDIRVLRQYRISPSCQPPQRQATLNIVILVKAHLDPQYVSPLHKKYLLLEILNYKKKS